MTKHDLTLRYQELLDEHKMYSLDGISLNSSKAELQNAISCLECADETMSEYFTVVKLVYPNTYTAISKVGYLNHKFNRLYVFNTARNIVRSHIA